MIDHYKEFFSKEEAGQEFLLCPLLTRQPLLIYLRPLVANEGYKIIDVGASANSWSDSVTAATADIKPLPSSKLHFQIDIQREKQWDRIVEYTEENGQFDFAICSHTIEDLHLPDVCLEYLPKIAKQGIVMVPSMNRELGRGDRGQPSKGYDHHHWCYACNEENELLMIPKMVHLEHKDYAIDTSGQRDELQMLWRGEIKKKHFWSYPHQTIWQLYNSFDLDTPTSANQQTTDQDT